MNPLIKIGILVLVDLYLFRLGFYFGIIGLIVVIVRILHMLGFLRNPSLSKGSFCEGITFLKDYSGPYYKSGAAFQEASNIIKTFKLDEEKSKYVLIGIFYDNPKEVEESKLRYSVGIYQRNIGFADKPKRDLESYCNDKDYYFAELPVASSLFGQWEFNNSFTMQKGIQKLNDLLESKLKDDSFLKTYRIKKGTKCPIHIELYETNTKVSYYAPLLQVEQFQLYKKDNKTN